MRQPCSERGTDGDPFDPGGGWIGRTQHFGKVYNTPALANIAGINNKVQA